MITRLDESYPGQAAFLRAAHKSIHQRAAGTVILHRRVDCYRAYAGNRIAFVQETAVGDLPLTFRDEIENTIMAYQGGMKSGRDVGAWEIRREIMRFGYGLESTIANIADRDAVLRRAPA